jgi:hypothetical protein
MRAHRPALHAALVAALAVVAPRAAVAQLAPPRGASVRPGSPVTLVVELAPGSALDEGRLRAAIAQELGTLVVREPGAAGGTLVVHQDGDAVTISFVGPGGRRDGRTIPLAGSAAQAEQDVALVAVNVARDQTAPFLASPQVEQPAPPLPPPPPAPAPAASSPSPCARLAVSRRSPFGIDFVPFAGTSSVDGGRSVRDVSIGALGAVSSGVYGAAISGLVNLDAGPVCGAEVAGLVNVAGGVEGLQVSGIAGVAAGDSSGAQVSLVNVASGRMRGAQVGLVSVAGDTNVQVGLVNVATDADVQVGLVNVDLHGRLRLDAWAKPEAGMLLAGLKHGPAHFHTIYAVEMSAASGRPWAVFGLGAHATPTSRLYLDVDLLQHTQLVDTSTSPNQVSEVRVVAGYTLAPHVSVFAGTSYNVLVGW